MSKLRFLIVILLIPFFTSLKSQNFTIKQDVKGYTVKIELDTLRFFSENNNDSIPVVPGATGIFNKGYPELLKFVHAFPLLGYEKLNLQVVSDEYIELQASISPSCGFVSKKNVLVERTMGDAYFKDDFYPNNMSRFFTSHIEGDIKKQTLWFFPLQYNAVQKTLRIHTSVEIRLTFETKLSAVNKSVLKAGDEFEKMLIITPNELRQALNPFVKWKNQKGIETYILSSDTLSTWADIKSTVKEYYQQKGIKYLLLVGDHHQTPAMNTAYGISDYVYGLVSGNDHYIDIGIGRFPAKNETELKNMIYKTIAYEQRVNAGNWINSFGGMASNENGENGGDNGESDIEHINKIKELLNQKSFNTTVVLEDVNESNSISAIVNKGCAYLFYIGHGDQTRWSSTPFSNDSVSKLTNYDMYPFVVDGACLNGDLEYPVCLAEKFMIASNNNKAIGSVAMLASTIEQLWAPPMLGQDVIAQNLFLSETDDVNTTISKVCNDAYYKMINTYSSGGIETAYTWMLYGDPSLKLWTKNPDELEVVVPEVFNVAKDTFTVFGPDSAIVSIMVNNVLLDAGIIQSGRANLLKGAGLISDSVEVSFSKQNYVPNIIKIPPYSNGSSFYNINSVLISDSNNNKPEYGELLNLQTELTNYGLITGNKVVIEAYSTDTLIEIVNNKVAIDSVKGESTKKVSGITFKVIQPVADGYTTKIILKVSDESGQINAREFNITFYAPVINIVGININGNPAISNEHVVSTYTVKVSMLLENSGHVATPRLKVLLKTDNIMLQALNDSLQTIIVENNSIDTVSFLFAIDTNCVQGWNFNGKIKLLETAHDTSFSFYFKQLPRISFNKGEVFEDEFPFYNYYKANKTQVLFTAAELGNSSIVIDSIAFNIASVPIDTSLHKLSGFSISIGELISDRFNNSFYKSDSVKQVYFRNTCTMPDKAGWVNFDIDNFSYSGNKNLLLEVNWGLNTVTAGFNNAFSVVAHFCNYEKTAYGYNDFDCPSPLTSVSKLRPDIIFYGKQEHLKNVFLKYENENPESGIDTICIKIGAKSIKLPIDDSIPISLPKGKYSYKLSISECSKVLNGGSFEVNNSGECFIVGFNNYIQACGSYLWHDTILTTSGVYVKTVKTEQETDSITMVNLQLTKINNDILLTDSSLTILEENAVLKIFDCQQYVVIDSLQTNTYIFSKNGVYAAIIEKNGCIDTLQCYTYSFLGVNSKHSQMFVYPNPSNGSFTISLTDKNLIGQKAVMYNAIGNLVRSITIEEQNQEVELKQLAAGVYFLKVLYNNKANRYKIVVE